jgi:PPOX class probable F420-dependent enzyme
MDERLSTYPGPRGAPTPTDQFPPAVEAFLRRPLAAHLATVNPSGSPQQTVMWFMYEDGDFLFSTIRGRVKYRNFLANPRAIVTILDPADMFRLVAARGRLTQDERDPVAFQWALGRHYLTDEGFALAQRISPTADRVVLRLTPTHRRMAGFAPD